MDGFWICMHLYMILFYFCNITDFIFVISQIRWNVKSLECYFFKYILRIMRIIVRFSCWLKKEKQIFYGTFIVILNVNKFIISFWSFIWVWWTTKFVEWRKTKRKQLLFVWVISYLNSSAFLLLYRILSRK